MSVGKFSELGENINYVIQLLLQDNDLLKLLHYNDYDPLSQSNVSNPSSLLFNNIFPYPKLPDVVEDKKSIVTVMFSNAKLTNNVEFKECLLIFNIMCHIDLWKVSGNIRPYLIAERIDTIFNEKRGSKLSIGSVIFDNYIYREYNPKFCGYYLTYKVQNFN